MLYPIPLRKDDQPCLILMCPLSQLGNGGNTGKITGRAIATLGRMNRMTDGTYRDVNGQTVTVTRTSNGYLLRYADGRTVSVRK
jgi:hypothetical protein